MPSLLLVNKLNSDSFHCSLNFILGSKRGTLKPHVHWISSSNKAKQKKKKKRKKEKKRKKRKRLQDTFKQLWNGKIVQEQIKFSFFSITASIIHRCTIYHFFFLCRLCCRSLPFNELVRRASASRPSGDFFYSEVWPRWDYNNAWK